MMPAIHQGISEMNALAFAGLSKTQQEQFYHCLSVIMENVQDLPANEVEIKLNKKRKK
jgi:hypothetical protein